MTDAVAWPGLEFSQALQGPQDEALAIQKARELLLSGELESPRNIREAAQNILDLGV